MSRLLGDFARGQVVNTKRFAIWALAAATTLATGCSGDDEDSTKQTSKGDRTADAGETEVDAGVQSYRISMTVPNVPPTTEGTQCVRVKLGNVGPVKIGRIHNRLSGHSHHFVVSSVTDPTATEQALYECPPFRAPLTGAPLTVTQKHDEEIVLPEGVGYALEDDQLMHLELHYINTSDEVADVTAEAELFPSTDTGEIKEAGFLLVGSLDIAIPPHSQHSTGDLFVATTPALEGVEYYAITGHTHRFGTNVTVGVAESANADATMIYEPASFDWSAPEVGYLKPTVQVPSGGGFRFSCEWDNPTDDTILYGESALTEMCFFWAYYYPRAPMQQTLLVRPTR